VRHSAISTAHRISWQEIQEKKEVTFFDLFHIFVASNCFDGLVCAALLLNALFLGLQVDNQARNPGEKEPTGFRVVDLMFCVTFTLELVLRFSCSGWSFFVAPGWGWNWFDLILVLLQLLEVIFLAVASSQDDGSGESSSRGASSVRVVRVFRVLRTLRVIRVLRLVRFVAELRKVLYLLLASFWSFVWTAVLLCMLIYILGIFITQVVADTWDSSPDVVASGMPLNMYYGSTLDSILTLYKAILGGQDWEVMSDPLMMHISPLMGVIFAMYVAFATLVLLNLVTGVFVDGAMKLSHEDRQDEILRKVRKAFNSSDEDESGFISPDEFDKVFETKEMQELFDLIELRTDRSKSKASNLFRILDVDGSGELTAEEFAAGAVALQVPVKGLDFLVHSHQWKEALRDVSQDIQTIQAHLGIQGTG
jgi:voltage-gated sodium channel